MQFEYTDPQTEFESLIGGFHSINAFGSIESGDDIRFQKFLESVSPPSRTMVYIDSSGGDVIAAIGIGRTIRDFWLHTGIGRYVLDESESSAPIVKRKLISGRCMSAATLMFIGGKHRHYASDSQFGVHQFSFRNPSPDDIALSQKLSAIISIFVFDMGIDPRFLELSASVESARIKQLRQDELEELNVVTGGRTGITWSVHAIAGAMYVRGERDSVFGHHKIMLCYQRESGFFIYAVIESQGRETELTTFPLVEIDLNNESYRIDISDRAARISVGMYINVFARLSKEEARIIAFSENFGLQIRASQDAHVFLGIGAMSTEGGKEQLSTIWALFENS